MPNSTITLELHLCPCLHYEILRLSALWVDRKARKNIPLSSCTLVLQLAEFLSREEKNADGYWLVIS